MTLSPGYDPAALDAAVDSATVKALTGDPLTDMYAEDGLQGLAALHDVDDWRTRTTLPESVERANLSCHPL